MLLTFLYNSYRSSVVSARRGVSALRDKKYIIYRDLLMDIKEKFKDHFEEFCELNNSYARSTSVNQKYHIRLIRPEKIEYVYFLMNVSVILKDILCQYTANNLGHLDIDNYALDNENTLYSLRATREAAIERISRLLLQSLEKELLQDIFDNSKKNRTSCIERKCQSRQMIVNMWLKSFQTDIYLKNSIRHVLNQTTHYSLNKTRYETPKLKP